MVTVTTSQVRTWVTAVAVADSSEVMDMHTVMGRCHTAGSIWRSNRCRPCISRRRGMKDRDAVEHVVVLVVSTLYHSICVGRDHERQR